MGCAKDEGIPERQQVSSQKNDPQRKVKDRILHFVEKVEESKSLVRTRDNTPPLSIEEAIWGAEAVLSVYYTNIENRFEKTNFSSSTVTVPLVDGLVEDSDLSVFYLAVWQEMQNHLDAIPWSNKQLSMIDLELGIMTNNQASIIVNTSVGKKTQQVLAPPYFEDGDDWQGGGTAGEGHCDGTNLESNAAKEFTKVINLHYRKDHPLVLPDDLPYYGWYVVGSYDVTTIVTDGGSYPDLIVPGNSDNYRDYTFFQLWPTNPNFEQYKCIDWETMNFYYDGLVDRIGSVETYFGGRSFISGEVLPFTNIAPGDGVIGHKLYSTLGYPLIIWGYPDPSWGSGGADTALDAIKEKLP